MFRQFPSDIELKAQLFHGELIPEGFGGFPDFILGRHCLSPIVLIGDVPSNLPSVPKTLLLSPLSERCLTNQLRAHFDLSVFQFRTRMSDNSQHQRVDHLLRYLIAAF